jgi:hypothetical protein
MNATSHFSRRLLAEFIALRIEAWRRDRQELALPIGDERQGGGPSPVVPGSQDGAEASALASVSEVRRRRLPGLANPRHPHRPGIG